MKVSLTTHWLAALDVGGMFLWFGGSLGDLHFFMSLQGRCYATPLTVAVLSVFLSLSLTDVG